MGEKLLALTPKRRRFVEEYRVDWNATQAAIRAGYSPKTANEQGSQLLAKLSIQEALAEVMAEDSARCQVRYEDVIAEVVKIGFVNIMDFMHIGDDGEPLVDLSNLTRAQAAGLVSFEVEDYKDGRGENARDVRRVKIRVADKVRPLTELLKLLKPIGEDAGDGVIIAQLRADEAMRQERMSEIAKRYLPKPEEESKAG